MMSRILSSFQAIELIQIRLQSLLLILIYSYQCKWNFGHFLVCQSCLYLIEDITHGLDSFLDVVTEHVDNSMTLRVVVFPDFSNTCLSSKIPDCQIISPVFILHNLVAHFLPFKPMVGLYVMIVPDSQFLLIDLFSSKCLMALNSALVDRVVTVFPDQLRPRMQMLYSKLPRHYCKSDCIKLNIKIIQQTIRFLIFLKSRTWLKQKLCQLWLRISILALRNIPNCRPYHTMIDQLSKNRYAYFLKPVANWDKFCCSTTVVTLKFYFHWGIYINLYKMEEPSREQTKVHKLPDLVDVASVVWIQNSQKLPFAEQQAIDQHDEYLKRQHQIYLAQKLKRKEEILKNKLKEFGDSSSDSDAQYEMQKNRTNDSSNQHRILKTFEYYSGKASSKADSQKEASLKKVQSVHVGPSKPAESIDVVNIFINSKKGVDIWIQQNLKFKDKFIKINELQCPFYLINKLKIIFTEVAEESYKIKVNWGNQQYIFAASKKRQHCDLPIVFYVFAKILIQKLEIMNKNKIYSQKVYQFPELLKKNSLIYGKILKKSRLINRWTSVYASINAEGLWFSKKYSDKQKLLVKRLQVAQVWTRFQFQQGHLIVKLFQNSSKIQIGIPVTNFMQQNSWLYYLYELAFKRY